MPSVPASEFQKHFGEWHDKIHDGPVEITRYGRPTAYLVSAKMFEQLWQRFRVALPVEQLSAEDVDLVMRAEVATNEPYDLGDLPDRDEDARAPRR